MIINRVNFYLHIELARQVDPARSGLWVHVGVVYTYAVLVFLTQRFSRAEEAFVNTSQCVLIHPRVAACGSEIESISDEKGEKLNKERTNSAFCFTQNKHNFF